MNLLPLRYGMVLNLTTAVSVATAAFAVEFDATGQPESIFKVVNFNRRGFLHEIFIYNISETFDVENLVGIFWLIQSHS